MRLAVLYSGGKDSTLALIRALRYHNVVCLITILSENKFSYFFHTSNIELTKYQAEAIGIDIFNFYTSGEKDVEIKDLENAIKECKKEFGIEGIVSGVIRSKYQLSRIKEICRKLDLFCLTPLWLISSREEIEEIEKNKIEAIITQVSSYPMDEKYLGRKIDRNVFEELEKMKIDFAGEGGEYETFVLDANIFKKRIEIVEFEKFFDEKENFGSFIIKKVKLIKK
ncbi:MAG: diphthine--ammonia ligase [Candidatus Aenigmarchaeota archaeon]|nr:diphthine--ammonia ligase [Candidatus Aenigmarchaeota archaeon]MDW8149326.1 diphthine--ammonia ligase [Candidatus Aenigmarchaeota archaeon]